MNYKIFIINLERSSDRKEIIEKQLKNYGVKNYEFITAIDGTTININPVLLPDNYKRLNVEEKHQKHFNINEIACIKSHVKALRKAKADGLDCVIIMEDDIIICEDWENRLKRIFDVLPLQWNHIYLSGYPTNYRKTIQPFNLSPFFHLEKSVVTMGAFSYMLKNTVFDVVMEHMSNYNLPTDNVISNLIESEDLKSYTAYPFLTYHDNDVESTIWDSDTTKNNSYGTYHESKYNFVNKL